MEFQKLNTPSSTTNSLLTLEAEFFTKLKTSGKSINTIKNYRTDIECFNKFLSEKQHSLDVNDFNFQKVSEYGEYLQNKYDSDNSRRRRVQALRIFFDFLVEKNIYSENPVRKLPSSPKFLDIPRPTTLPEVQKLWSHLCREVSTNVQLMPKLVALRNQMIFTLIYTGGLKVSDLSGLKFSHIDVTGEKPRVLVTTTKRDPYTVELHPVFHTVFRNYSQMLIEGKKYCKLEFDELLFNANPFKILRGGLSPRGIELIFEDFRKRLSIVVTPKSLRQAAIFNWLGKGLNDGVIKEWLGVAPSYSLKLYKSHSKDHIYSEEFLMAMLRENTSPTFH